MFQLNPIIPANQRSAVMSPDSQTHITSSAPSPYPEQGHAVSATIDVHKIYFKEFMIFFHNLGIFSKHGKESFE